MIGTEFTIGGAKNINIAYANVSQVIRSAYGTDGLSKMKDDEETGVITFYPVYNRVPEDMYEKLTVAIYPPEEEKKARILIEFDNEEEGETESIDPPEPDPDLSLYSGGDGFMALSEPGPLEGQDGPLPKEEEEEEEEDEDEEPEKEVDTRTPVKVPYLTGPEQELTEEDYKDILKKEYQNLTRIVPAAMGIY